MKSAATHLAALVVLALPSFALAQTQRLSGTIVSVDGPTLVLKTDKGEEVKLNLAEKGTVLAVEKVTIDAVLVKVTIPGAAIPRAP